MTSLVEPIRPEWPAPASVRGFVTTRAMGDMAGAGRAALRVLVPAEPTWLKQVHGIRVADLDRESGALEADAAVTRAPRRICVVGAADCMPVLLADRAGRVVAAAHAGWRGMAAGVIESALESMKVSPAEVLAWLGPAIGPRAYEVGEEVREAFLAHDAAAADAFQPTRPGHWLLDLYAVARQRLRAAGVGPIFGGGFCTFTQADRFFSFRRDRTRERMAAVIWLEPAE